MGIGTATPRLDGRLKVTGSAQYGSDVSFAKPVYAYLATSAIAKGRIAEIDERESRALPGVIDIFTYRNIGHIEPGQTFAKNGYMGTSIAPLASAEIFHDGQIVAVAVAHTFEAAREAAHRLKFRYAEDTPSAGFDSAGSHTVALCDIKSAKHEDPSVGDAEAAYSGAAVKLDQHYSTATQHHNPIELFTTACAWSNGKLTVWESSQNMWGFKNGLAQQLGIAPENIETISPFVGGAFGSRGSLTQRTAIIARIARKIARPVKLVAARDQGFTIATYRAETRHHIKLGATHAGELVSLTHNGYEVTSRPDDYNVSGTESSTRLYACPNVASKVSIVHADRNTPGFMRSPPETPYLFALESAMDELSYALGMDPVELRRVNDTIKEPIKGLPYSSRSLMQCFDEASSRFGWSKREKQPAAMRDGEWLVGWGTAATMYPSNIAPCTARVTLYPNGNARVQVATHEIGTGIYTVCALVTSDRLGISSENVEVEIGDSKYPPAPVSGGSNSTASVGNAIAQACDEILAKKARGANGVIEAYAENLPKGAPKEGIQKLYKGQPSFVGGSHGKEDIRYAFGAHFIEVRVHGLTGEIRVPRSVSAFAAGTIVNPTTAKSQLMGGVIWGISAALHEATEIDRKLARYYNDDLAEYMIPVNSDIGEVEIIMVPEKDNDVNPLGIKGIGELGNVGMNAAVANAVYHATGVRIRDLPIRLEKLLSSRGLTQYRFDDRGS